MSSPDGLPHKSPALPPRPIFLVGMMGAGKTTVGRALAAALGCGFIDLDQRIERIWGRTVADLFLEGEAGFRRLEHAALASLLREPGFLRRRSVVATGGGVPTMSENVPMLSQGTRIFLDVPVGALADRLSSDAQRAARPLLRGLVHKGAALHREDGGQDAAGAAPDTGRGAQGTLGQHLHELLERRRRAYEAADLRMDAARPTELVVADILVELHAMGAGTRT